MKSKHLFIVFVFLFVASMITSSNYAIACTPGRGVTAQSDLTDFAASLETIRQTLKIPGMSVGVFELSLVRFFVRILMSTFAICDER